MRQLEDRLLATIVIASSLLLSVMFSLIKNLGPGRPVLNKIICSGVYKPSQEHLGDVIPMYQIVVALGFVTYLILWARIKYIQYKYQLQDHQVQNQGSSKNLESLAMNVSLMIILIMAAYCASMMNNGYVRPSQLNDISNWIFPYFNSFIAPFLATTLMAAITLKKNGRELVKHFYQRDAVVEIEMKDVIKTKAKRQGSKTESNNSSSEFQEIS